jgi:dihydrolipoamide dehydrogenase
MMADSFDVVVIGAGPGGYPAAIRAAQLGMKVAVAEMRETLGGTCLNIGCIPSKAMLQSSEKYEETKHALAQHGIKVTGVEVDLAAMLSRKDKVVEANVKGIEFLFKKHKIEWLKGRAKFTGPGKLDVAGRTVEANNVIIATGSDVMPLPGVAIDEKKIVSSTGALELPQIPKRLVVVGAGYIGLEMGSVWRRLGSEVSVVEFLDRITPGMDAELARHLQRVLTKQGMKFNLGSKVTAAKSSRNGVTLTIEPAKGGEKSEIEADVVLVSIGRRAYTDGLGLETVGVQVDNRGRVEIDKQFRTSVSGIFAIGDVVAGPMLAHKAEDEGIACAEIIAGQKPHIDYDAIPAVVYTWPEVATVGKSEDDLKAAGTAYRTGKFPFTANGRARANGDTEGFVKILADAKTDRVLGVHIIGPDAGTLIAEAALAMEYGASSEDIARTCHAHPTLSEAVKEAALAVAGRPIHI